MFDERVIVAVTFPQINGEDVTTASHEHVVDLIRKSGELVRMTVVSPVISLPNSQSAALLPTSQPIQRQYATLPRKGNNNVAIGGTLGRSPAPMPPRRDPKTTLSVGRARARSMVAGLGMLRLSARDIRILRFKLRTVELNGPSLDMLRRRRREGRSRRNYVDRGQIE